MNNAIKNIGKSLIITIMVGLLFAPMLARNAMAEFPVPGGVWSGACTQDCDCTQSCGPPPPPASAASVLEVNGPWCFNGFCQFRNTANVLPLGATCNIGCQCNDIFCDPNNLPNPTLVPGRIFCNSCGPEWDGATPWTGAKAPYSHHPLGVCTTSLSTCGSSPPESPPESPTESPPAPEMSDYIAGAFLLLAGGIIYLIRRRMLGGG